MLTLSETKVNILLDILLADVDFSAVQTEVVFQSGMIESCAQIVIIDDSIALEGDETIVITFTPPSGIQQGSPSSSTVTIIDNDRESYSPTSYIHML